MGTSLTGLTPATTYDALIKVGDNGPLSATAKVLSDGLGNDSPLAMSTTLVGIGTATPTNKLTILGGNGNQLNLDNTGERYTQMSFVNNGSQKSAIWIDETNDEFVLFATTGYTVPIYANGVERVRVTADGLTFNGDTAAANALDDYEEGTFTATLGASTTNPLTAVTTTARYTKIGNVVNYSINFSNVSTIGAVGQILVSGLPFTSNSTQVSQGGVAAHTMANLNGALFTVAFIGGTTTQIQLLGTQNNGAWLDTNINAAANTWLFISGTYFV
jgi:hypothetical protein